MSVIEKPTAPFVLSLIAGVLIIFGGGTGMMWASSGMQMSGGMGGGMMGGMMDGMMGGLAGYDGRHGFWGLPFNDDDLGHDFRRNHIDRFSYAIQSA
ncbi:MAG: hypothetical protein FJ358_04285 [Thaumarchaeota archaeon]|nr:hypothetical protein [Nitrososphaerota archaeon]